MVLRLKRGRVGRRRPQRATGRSPFFFVVGAHPSGCASFFTLDAMAIVRNVNDMRPRIAENVFLAENATVLVSHTVDSPLTLAL